MNEEPSAPLDEQLPPVLLSCDKALAAGTAYLDPPNAEPFPEAGRPCCFGLGDALPPSDTSEEEKPTSAQRHE